MNTEWPVRNSAELQRVAALPRREWLPENALALAEQWSPQLLNARGRAAWDSLAMLPPAQRERELERWGKSGRPLRMNNTQAMAGYDFLQVGGLILAAPVGKGKTFTSLLLCLLAQKYWGFDRFALLVSASGEKQTHEDLAKLVEVWQAPRPMPQVFTYQSLGRVEQAFALCGCPECVREHDADGKPLDFGGFRPQLVVGDEVDMLRNPDAAVTRRVDRLFVRHEETRFAGMTGTLLRHTYRNAEHLMRWALKHGAPVPFDYTTREEVAQAIDNKPREGAARPPGALKQFAPPGTEHLNWNGITEEVQKAARQGWAKRMGDTPGVILDDESSCDQPLHIHLLEAPPDPVLDVEFLRFRGSQTTFDGWLLADPFSLLRYGTELGDGAVSYWDPRPPVPWSEARKDLNRFVKEKIEGSQAKKKPLDSELAVLQAYPEHPIVVRWREIKPTFKPNSVTQPVSYSVVTYAAQWLRNNGPALCWVQHSWTGRTLSRLTGLPYFEGEGKSVEGYYIDDYKKTKQSCILSTDANWRQRNLQHDYTKALVLGPKPGAHFTEQTIGRVHRQGQDHPVHWYYVLSCRENLNAIAAMVQEAQAATDTSTLPQKILDATWDWTQVSPYVTDPTMLAKDDPRRARW
jgi:hypothetical protein